jgi:hypothetical protein
MNLVRGTLMRRMLMQPMKRSRLDGGKEGRGGEGRGRRRNMLMVDGGRGRGIDLRPRSRLLRRLLNDGIGREIGMGIEGGGMRVEVPPRM